MDFELSRKTRIALFVAIMGVAIAVMAIALTGAGIIPQIDMFADGTLVAEKEGLDLVGGSGVTVSAVELSNRVEYTLSTTAPATAGAIALDLGDNGSDESVALIRINVTAADSNSIFTETVPDELTITPANAWPAADALSADPSDCAAGTKAISIVASGDLTCTAVTTTDITNNT
ncbi:hypothetical protein LCGC14_2242580, partial [marine sediment metagenome]